jgi:hypothetical protein
MASENTRQFSQAEYERAFEAYGEWKLKGATELTCLHCGTGHFQFIEKGSSVEIRCETPDCLVTGIRGV